MLQLPLSLQLLTTDDDGDDGDDGEDDDDNEGLRKPQTKFHLLF